MVRVNMKKGLLLNMAFTKERYLRVSKSSGRKVDGCILWDILASITCNMC